MKIKMPELSKVEIIMMFLNQWNPVCGVDSDFRFYQVEAEEIAQKIRKNSKLESVEKTIRETVEFRMRLDNINVPFDENACRMYSELILSALR